MLGSTERLQKLVRNGRLNAIKARSSHDCDKSEYLSAAKPTAAYYAKLLPRQNQVRNAMLHLIKRLRELQCSERLKREQH